MQLLLYHGIRLIFL